MQIYRNGNAKPKMTTQYIRQPNDKHSNNIGKREFRLRINRRYFRDMHDKILHIKRALVFLLVGF